MPTYFKLEGSNVKRILFSILRLLPLFLIAPEARAQGCSDAGVCTAGSLGVAADSGSSSRHTLQLAYQFALGEQSTQQHFLTAQWDARLSDLWSFQVKLPVQWVHGNLGNHGGLGDVTTSFNANIPLGRAAFRPGAGMRWNSSDANAMRDGRALPMPYQRSLGTKDLLVFTALVHPRWRFGAGIQLPLSGESGNQFDTLGLNPSDRAYAYFPSVNLDRKPDLALRYDRLWQRGNWDMETGMVLIWKLQEATIRRTNELPIELEGSDGPTLNLAAVLRYFPGGDRQEGQSLAISWANPVHVRPVRPDGLTRSAILGISWQNRF